MVKRRHKHNNPNNISVDVVAQLLLREMYSFGETPPISSFQKGYAACILSLYEELFLTQEQRREHRRVNKSLIVSLLEKAT